ncbi:hypothetical protein F1D05_20290 [Kribbella qitaiheensis]|uniref:Uncharacterized protein n=1 Tax=Kribbella qitaiheensis TaxID=1544730 RepID=A0A7G6X0R1_9ACTN|nr:hypothetical protein [Kribbella qitaiheensis]QNE19826.1 hypothetical protein F1D05_20290 [Kribbella qitaiheensis]
MTATDEVTAALHLLNSARYVDRSAGPPDSLPALLAAHARAAIQVSGADQTAWNGHVIEAGEGILGVAHWDGTLQLDRECILDPLRELYESPGVRQPDEALIRCREALVTVLHEQSHFLGPAGATQDAARAAFRLPGARPLEEGVAEAWAQDHLNEYLDRLGIEEVAPGISQVRSAPSYQAFVPAVRVLTTDLDRRAGLPRGETLRALNRQTAEGQWPLIVDSAYRSSRLPDLVPADREPAVRLRLETTLRNSFDSLAQFETEPRDLAATKSLAAGYRSVHRLTEEIATAEAIFEPPQPLSPTRPTAETLPLRKALSGLAPPTAPAQPAPAHPAARAVTGPHRAYSAAVRQGVVSRSG